MASQLPTVERCDRLALDQDEQLRPELQRGIRTATTLIDLERRRIDATSDADAKQQPSSGVECSRKRLKPDLGLTRLADLRPADTLGKAAATGPGGSLKRDGQRTREVVLELLAASQRRIIESRATVSKEDVEVTAFKVHREIVAAARATTLPEYEKRKFRPATRAKQHSGSGVTGSSIS